MQLQDRRQQRRDKMVQEKQKKTAGCLEKANNWNKRVGKDRQKKKLEFNAGPV
jgi:uncharacterized iron-regulated protein